jgi:hypothetical protein
MCYVSEAIYPPEFAIKPDLMKAVWFKYMMVDEACKWWRLRQDGAMHCPHAPGPHLNTVGCLTAIIAGRSGELWR